MSEQPMKQDDCNRLRLECPTREAVYGKDGLKDETKEILKAIMHVELRLARIEWGALFAVGAWTFFSQILPAMVRMGQAIK
jgi:hypothetical protein